MRKISPNTLPGRLKILRKRLGITQAEMARQLNISLSRYSKLEIAVGKVSAALAENICRQFSLPESWLLHGEGDLPASVSCPVELSQPEKRPTEAQILKILELAQAPAARALAQQIGLTLQLSFAQALAVVVKENWEQGSR